MKYSTKNVKEILFSLVLETKNSHDHCGSVTGGEFECAICLSNEEPSSRHRILECKHKFHAKCINKWSLISKTCPLCRVISSTQHVAHKNEI
jgi:hypothetical protein